MGKTFFTGIQPTNDLTIANYAFLKQFLQKQRDDEGYFCVVDLHALTLPKDPLALKEMIDRLYALYVVCGVDLTKSTLFVQSHVPQHSELAWLLTCNSYMGELNRMTQFKDKVAGLGGNAEEASESEAGVERKARANNVSIPTGLYMYPVLMAADILLYDVDYVPVGADQKQHVELTRNIAERMNQKFGSLYKVPEPVIAKAEEGAKIMSLDLPGEKKMSKSSTVKNSKIGMNYTAAEIKTAISKAVTDSEGQVRYAPTEKPGVSNLMVIHSTFSGLSIPEIETRFEGQGYGALKKDLTELITTEVLDVQQKIEALVKSGDLRDMMAEGAEKAKRKASEVLLRTQKALGIR